MFATRTMTKTCPYCAEEVQAEAVKCKHCLSWIGDGASGTNGQPQAWLPFAGGRGAGASGKAPWRLVRPANDRKLTGVCAGIARFLGVDPTIIRVLWVIASVFTLGLPMVLAYALLSFVIPAEDDVRTMG